MTTPVTSHIQLGTVLGGGHFGTVHIGDHPVHGRVAIKVIERRPGESDKDWSSRRDDLLAEGQHLKAAEHERVVRVFDVTHDASSDRVYLILELCTKGSLEVPYNKGPMALPEVRNAITEAALGLECVHSRSLLHRDIKPANILLAADGRAKLGDFGLVTDRLVLGYGSATGYSDHIAFEVWHTGTTSIRSDIWALGMTTYRLLHGKEFYERLPHPRMVVANGGFAHSLPWLAHVPKEWQRLVRKCLHDEPSSRYQSAQQVLEALGKLPIVPDWSCEYTPDKTTWRRQIGARVIEAAHLVHSPRKHEWYVLSRPDPSGKPRRIAGANGVASRRKALEELHDYLTKQPSRRTK